MHTPLQTPLQPESQSDAAQRTATKTAAHKRSLVDDRPEPVAQRKLQDKINSNPPVLQQKAFADNRPRMMQQKAQMDAIHNSPRMVAQRQKMNALFGDTVQRQVTDNRPAAGTMRELDVLANQSVRATQLKTMRAVADRATPHHQADLGGGHADGALPDGLRSGVERLSGVGMASVRVHYNSARPAQLKAHAYAQGRDIYLGPGQENHLPHEAWHVAQQAQGRVRPTVQMKSGVPINDDKSLEHEADVMGARAMSLGGADHIAGSGALVSLQRRMADSAAPIQGAWIQEDENTLVWHATRDGVLWRFDARTELMGFVIRKLPESLPKEAAEFYIAHEGQYLSHEEWLNLMGGQFGDLDDSDDPVHEFPQFLLDEQSGMKMNAMHRISLVLRSGGVGVFLGGAASGALITATRPVKDLDLRIDTLDGKPAPRDLFNVSKHGAIFQDRIVKPLESAKMAVTDIEDVGHTTRRFMLDGSIDVSITSEPASDKTMTRGEMVQGITSLGEIDFLLDKAAAMVGRDFQEKQLTDLVDVIQVGKAMAGSGYLVLSMLVEMRGVKVSKVNNFVNTVLRQIANPGKGSMNKQRASLAAMLKVNVKDVPGLIAPVIAALSQQIESVEVV